MELSGLARLQRTRWVAAGEEVSSASFGVWIKLEGGDFPGPSLEIRLVHTELGFPNTALLLGTCKAKFSLQCCFSQAWNDPLLTRYGGTCLEGGVWVTLGFPEADDLERKEGHSEWRHSLLFVTEGQTDGKKHHSWHHTGNLLCFSWSVYVIVLSTHKHLESCPVSESWEGGGKWTEAEGAGRGSPARKVHGVKEGGGEPEEGSGWEWDGRKWN